MGDTGGDPMCEYSTQPFTIEELDDTGSNEVRFSFTNNWPTTMSDIELRYDRGDGLGPQCQSLNSLSSGAMYPNTLAATCDPETQTADIEVYVSSNSITHSSSRNHCGAGPGSCSYVYKIPCSTNIMCDDIRVRQLNGIGDQLGQDGNENILRGFMTEEMKAAGEPGEDSVDAPFCAHNDYPCKGDGKRWSMFAITLHKKVIKPFVSLRLILISYNLMTETIVDHVMDGTESKTLLNSSNKYYVKK